MKKKREQPNAGQPAYIFRQKFYTTLATVCFICAYTINLDELPLLPALAIATVFWGGFAFAASRVELDEAEFEEEPDTED